MERMDQYVKECYYQQQKDQKENNNVNIPSYLREDFIETELKQFNSFEDILNNHNNENRNIWIALVARYQYYLWLKKKIYLQIIKKIKLQMKIRKIFKYGFNCDDLAKI